MRSIIAVPGYCTPAAPEWGMKQELHRAVRSLHSVSNLYMYIYNPDYVPRDEFSWEGFLKAGSDLAEDLAKLSDEVNKGNVFTTALRFADFISSRSPYHIHRPVPWGSPPQEGMGIAGI